MFKRANKITALLVAAAAVVSIVPATAANAAERLGTKEGTIEKAYAFKDGKYIYDGYRTDEDNNSVYYNAGSGQKDNELKDLTDANLDGKYNTNGAKAKDGDDEYLVDLATGKVSDEDLASDDLSTAANKLESKLEKTDRYEKKDFKVNDDQLTQIANNQFGEVWYQYKATTSTGVEVYGYTDKSGKYVDAGVTANLRVFNGKEMVKIDEFGEDTDGITATVTGTPVTVAQDKDYFYRVVDVNFTTTSSANVKDLDGNVIKQAKYLQKISKAQGDTEKDAYLPKTVESYELVGKSADKDIISGDVTTAKDKLANLTADNLDGDDSKVIGVKVVDGIIYYTEMDDSDTVKTYKLKLQKNEKVDAIKAAANINDKTKVDAYVVKKDGDKDHDVKGTAGKAGVSIDVNGNVWVINEGEILKSEKAGDFKVMYTCDRSLDSLDVYDNGSLVAWDQSGDVYTTVQEGKSEANKEVTPAQTGWVNTAAGWTFYDAAGKQVKGAWTNAGGVWYMIKADGVMATGWYNDNGTWYNLNASGAMQTGWVNANGTWYFLQSSGAMKTGWLNDNGTWYYLNANGSMAANTTVDGYTLGANGAWVK